jgi:Flp pilus assembly CpaF family ATPase
MGNSYNKFNIFSKNIKTYKIFIGGFESSGKTTLLYQAKLH